MATRQEVRETVLMMQNSGASPDEIRAYVKSVASAKPEPKQGVSEYKSAFAGGVQGATLGFADEAIGLARGPGMDILKLRTPTVESYRGERDRARGQFDRLRADNPKSYMAGEFAGGAATALIPGTQGITLPKLAAMGAAQGLGGSNADLTRGDVAGAATDTAIGGATGVILPKIIPGAGRLGKAAVKRTFSSVLGPSEDAVSAYLARPKAIKGASMEGLAEAMPEVGNKFKVIIKDRTKKARALLSTSKFIEKSDTDAGGAFTKDEVFGVLENTRRKLGGIYTDQARTASKTLNRIGENLKKKGNTLSQNEVGNLIGDIDREIPWDAAVRQPELLTKSDETLISLRRGLDNSLKEKNPDYGTAIKSAEEAIQGNNEFLTKFAVKRIKGEGFQPSDTTYSRVNTALKEGKLETDRIINNVRKITGIDLTPKIQDAKYAQEFVGGRTNGSRNVNTGAYVGAGVAGTAGAIGLPIIGTPLGLAAGGLAGNYIDKKGGEIAAKTLDKYIASKETAGAAGSYVAGKLQNILKVKPGTLGKYATILKNSARLGTQQVSLTHWLLMDSDPEYKKLVTEIESNKKE